MEVLADGTTVYCHCKRPEADDSTLIGCDFCDGWYHLACIQPYTPVRDASYIDKFCCRDCANRAPREGDPGKNVTTYKRLCGNKGCGKLARLVEGSKFCSERCEEKWARKVVEQMGKDDRARVRAMLEQVPEGMAQYVGVTPGQIPGVDIPLEGQQSLDESPYYLRLNKRWDTDDVAEGMRDSLVARFSEDNGGFKYVHDKTIAEQTALIADLETQLQAVHNRTAFFEAARTFSKEFVKQYKEENGIETPPPKAKRVKYSMNNPPPDICGYDYRLHANDAWHAAWSASEEGQAVLAGTKGVERDDSGSIFGDGGVESVDPTTVAGTICIKMKCKTHYDWALVAANQYRTGREILEDEIADARTMIEKMGAILKGKEAKCKLGRHWMKMELKKLDREQLDFMGRDAGEQMNGDLLELFKHCYKEVQKKMPRELEEPAEDPNGDGDVKMEDAETREVSAS